MKRSFRVPPPLAALLLLVSLPARAQLINAGFEQGPAPQSPQGSVTLYNASTAVPGWVVTGDLVLYGRTDWAAQEGASSIGLYDASFPFVHPAIAQTFASVPGTSYTVTFWYAPAPLSGPMFGRNLAVRAAGQEFPFSTSDQGAPASAPTWRMGTVSFTATSTSTMLEFANVGDGQKGGLVLDNVQMSGVVATRPTSWGRVKALFR